MNYPYSQLTETGVTEFIDHIDRVIQNSTPTKLIKRGNAFSLIELTDKFKIEDTLTRIEFDGINITRFSEKPTLRFSGEYYILEDSFREEEYDLTVEVLSAGTDPTQLIIKNYELDIAQKEIFLTFVLVLRET